MLRAGLQVYLPRGASQMIGLLRLRFWRGVMFTAWTCDEYADSFVEWAQQKYANVLYGIGSIE